MAESREHFRHTVPPGLQQQTDGDYTKPLGQPLGTRAQRPGPLPVGPRGTAVAAQQPTAGTRALWRGEAALLQLCRGLAALVAAPSNTAGFRPTSASIAPLYTRPWQTQMVLRPGNAQLCGTQPEGSGRKQECVVPSEPLEGAPLADIYCQLQPAQLPACAHSAASCASSVSGTHLAVVLSSTALLAAAAAAAALRMWRRRRAAAAPLLAQLRQGGQSLRRSSKQPLEAAGSAEQAALEHARLVSEDPALAPSGALELDSPAAAAAASERPAASWGLQTRSLQLSASDFTIAVDAQKRPVLLGQGSFGRVRGWLAASVHAPAVERCQVPGPHALPMHPSLTRRCTAASCMARCLSL